MAGQLIAPEKIRRESLDGVLVGSLFLLLSLGLVMLFSASYHRSGVIYNDNLKFFVNQLIYAAVGLVGMVVLAFLPQDFIRKWSPLALLVSMGLLLLPFVPGIGAEFLGGRHWIRIGGSTFQPVELVKLTEVLYLASYLDAKKDDLAVSARALLPPFVILVLISLIIFLQNDLSSALLVFVIAMSVFFAAGVRFRHLLVVLLSLVPLLVLSLFTRAHRLERISTYFDAAADPLGAGYQVLASLSALRAGGFAGAGIGQGVRKLGTLPEAQSDFIFAVLGEELGFLGVVLVIGLFGLFAWRAFRLCYREPRLYPRLLVFGVASAILLQAILNLGVVSALFPATGITLPFFSSGGSSLVATLLMAGVILNVSRNMGRQVAEVDHE